MRLLLSSCPWRGALAIAVSVLFLAGMVDASHELVVREATGSAASALPWQTAAFQGLLAHAGAMNAGGTEAAEGRFPYVCSLRHHAAGYHFCSGTLVHPLWVVTAAHCLDTAFDIHADSKPTVNCGVLELGAPGDSHIFSAVESVLHDEWQHDVEKGFDIALIRLDREAPFETARYDAAGALFPSGQFFVALGWGRTASGMATVLKTTDMLPFVPPYLCSEMLDMRVQTHWLCAGLSGRDAVGGDTGGPLVVPYAPGRDVAAGSPEHDLLVGITSFGSGCECDAASPGVFTELYHFAEWMDGVMNAQERVPEETEATPPPPPQEPSPVEVCRAELHGLPEEQLEKRMAEAIEKDDEVCVEAALLEGIEPNGLSDGATRFDNGATWLDWAAYCDAVESSKILLDHGAEVDHQENYGKTPLHYAAWTNSAEAAKMLLDHGAEVDLEDDFEQTPLMVAATRNFVELAKVLLDHDAEVDHEGVDGKTPLQEATAKDGVEVAKVLLDHDAEVDHQDNYERTPLHMAASNCAFEVATVLVAAGASKTIEDYDGQTPKERLFAWCKGTDAGDRLATLLTPP